MMKACEYSLRDVAGRCVRGGFSREEIKQNIQYRLIWEHNFEAVFEVIESALSLLVWSVAFAAMTVKNKHKAHMEAIPFSLILHELLLTDISFV